MESNSAQNLYSFVLELKEGSYSPEFTGSIVLADGAEIGLRDGTYIVRVWLENGSGLARGKIFQLSSGESIYFQTGDRVGEFVRKVIREFPEAGAPLSGESRDLE